MIVDPDLHVVSQCMGASCQPQKAATQTVDRVQSSIEHWQGELKRANDNDDDHYSLQIKQAILPELERQLVAATAHNQEQATSQLPGDVFVAFTLGTYCSTSPLHLLFGQRCLLRMCLRAA